MKLAYLSLLALSTSLVPALAEDIKLPSHIDAVTVYPQGADIVRVGMLTLQAGEHTLLLNDLPGGIDPQSVRVEGTSTTGLEIVSVDSKVSALTSVDLDAKRQAVNYQIEGLMDERGALDQTIADAQAQHQFLLSLAEKQLQPASTTETLKPVDASVLGGLMDVVGTRLAAISKTIHDAQLRQRAIDKAVADFNVKLQDLAPSEEAHLQVAVHVANAAALNGSLKVSYRIGGAGWQPFYDAKLALPHDGKKAQIDVVRRAEVMQATGEAWDNVALTLSTARPGGSTAAPDLGENPLQVAVAESLGRTEVDDAAVPAAPALEANKLKRRGDLEQFAKDGDKKDEVSAVQRQAMIEMAGFNANYVIAGRVDIDNTGTAKKVRISSDHFEAALQAITVPRLDANAYLTAAFTMSGDAPYLPGVVNLFRDGMFVGQGTLPQLASGEEAKLGFGVDDMIKVQRAEVKHNSGTEGLISTSTVQEMGWDITVKNLHDMAIPVTVIDRKPFSTQSDVTVEDRRDMTPATVTDFEKKRGVLAWNFELDPKAEKTVKTGYKVTAPEAINLSMNQ
jgi:uncharacterized protein (TIGR02231 family)